MVARSEAAGAASIDVISGLPEQPRLIGQVAERQVASVAEQSTVAPAFVAMVNVEPTPSIVAAADVAKEGPCREFRLFAVKAVALHEIGDRGHFRGSAIMPIFSFSTLRAMLRAVVAHSSIFADAAGRLSAVLRDVVEAKFGNWAGVTAPAASLGFHSISRSKIGRVRRAGALA